MDVNFQFSDSRIPGFPVSGFYSIRKYKTNLTSHLFYGIFADDKSAPPPGYRPPTSLADAAIDPVLAANASVLFRHTASSGGYGKSEQGSGNPHLRFLWSVLRRQREIRVFALPEPRPPLVVFDRYMHMDSELGE